MSVSKDFILGFQSAILWLSAGKDSAACQELFRAARKELDELEKSESNQQAVNRIVALMVHTPSND